MTRIGIVGHRDIAPESIPLVAGALHRLLRAQGGRRLVGVASLLPGADQLFARTVLELSGRLEVIVPARDYREQLTVPSELAEFDELRAAAATVRVMEFEHTGRQAFLAAGTALLAGVETLAAVWDGRPPRAGGRDTGTAGMVSAAGRLGLPTTIVWPDGATRSPRPPSGRTPVAQPA